MLVFVRATGERGEHLVAPVAEFLDESGVGAVVTVDGHIFHSCEEGLGSDGGQKRNLPVRT